MQKKYTTSNTDVIPDVVDAPKKQKCDPKVHRRRNIKMLLKTSDLQLQNTKSATRMLNAKMDKGPTKCAKMYMVKMDNNNNNIERLNRFNHKTLA